MELPHGCHMVACSCQRHAAVFSHKKIPSAMTRAVISAIHMHCHTSRDCAGRQVAPGDGIVGCATASPFTATIMRHNPSLIQPLRPRPAPWLLGGCPMFDVSVLPPVCHVVNQTKQTLRLGSCAFAAPAGNQTLMHLFEPPHAAALYFTPLPACAYFA